MSCVRPAFPLVFVTVLAVAGQTAKPDPTPAGPDGAPVVLAAPAPDAAPARPRAISPAVAAQLAVVGPKFIAREQTKPAEAAPDLREIDKPRNTIIRLPHYVVREEKPPIFKERELLTPKGRLEFALKKYPGLRFGSFWIFRNDGLALAMLAEDERLERKREFENLAELMRISESDSAAVVKREVERVFLREPRFGR